MRGAALATIIGQIVSFGISLRYMFHFKTIRLTKESFHMTGRHIENIFKFGASACFNQIAMTIVQIVLNNTLSHYGAQSVYGGDIPLACAGIITKVNMIFMSFVIGISQGIQPIIGFNYGAEKYERVRKSYLLALGTATVLSELHFSVSRYSRDRLSAYLVREVSCIFSFQSGISESICFLRLSMESSRLHRTFSTPSENRSWVYLCP